MDNKSGKTFRYMDKNKQKDSMLFALFPKNYQGSIELFGHEFHHNLQYSMKKKRRWQLPSLITRGEQEEDCALRYSKQQCIQDCTPIKDVYIYDSITGKEMGSVDVSNRKLAKNSFNLRSVVHEIENKQYLTKREKKTFEKIKKQKYNNNKKAFHKLRMTDVELTAKFEHFQEQALCQDLVTLHEYIPITDLSTVNMNKNYSFKLYNKSKKKLIKTPESISDNDCESDEEENVVDQMEAEEERRPFIITGKDFDCTYQVNTHKRMKSQKKRQCNEKKYILEKERITELEIVEEDYIETDVYEEKVPNVVVDLSLPLFLEEMHSVVIFCKCWMSTATPLTILVDLDQFEESRKKSFILLQPSIQKKEETISMKVFFNVDNDTFECDDILKQSFTSIISIITFLQSRLTSGLRDRSSSMSNLAIFEGSIDKLTNLSTVKKLDNQNALYTYDNEWKSCELKVEDVGSMMDRNGCMNYSMEDCNVCGCETPDDKMWKIGQCKHRICENCLSKYISFQLKRNKEKVVCPFQECFVNLDPATILAFVTWRRYCTRLSKLESNVISKCGAPCYTCSTRLINLDSLERETKDVAYLCECGIHICGSCGQLYHRPSFCNEMKEHNLRVVQYERKNIVTEKPKRIFDDEITCSNCHNKINSSKYKPVTNKCSCQKIYCLNCRKKYGIHKMSCKIYGRDKSASSNISEIISVQSPKSSKLKFYNESVYLRLLSRPNNLCSFRNDLIRIMPLTLVTRVKYNSVDEMVSSYSQVLRILESMYVAAYNIYQQSSPGELELLKVSTAHLLFIVGRIQALKDEIHNLKEARNNKFAETISQKYSQLKDNIDNAKQYTMKIINLIKR